MNEYLFEKLHGLSPKEILEALSHVRLSVIYDLMEQMEADSIYELAELMATA